MYIIIIMIMITSCDLGFSMPDERSSGGGGETKIKGGAAELGAGERAADGAKGLPGQGTGSCAGAGGFSPIRLQSAPVRV